MTLLESAAPLFATVKRYDTSLLGAIEVCVSAAASTFRFGLCPPKSMSPLQSPKILKDANTHFRPIMLVLTMLTTLAEEYASPVLMVPVACSVTAIFFPVSAQTSTFVLSVASFVEDAINADELYSPCEVPGRAPFPVDVISIPYSVLCQVKPSGSPLTVPLQFPDTRNISATEAPPALVWFAAV